MTTILRDRIPTALRTSSYGQYIVGEAVERPAYQHEIAREVARWMENDCEDKSYSLLLLFEKWHGLKENEPFQIDRMDVITQEQRRSSGVSNEMFYWAKCVYGLWRRNLNNDWTLPDLDRKQNVKNETQA